MSIMVEVYGDYAAFNRPELKVERMTYDVITPSAARGILDAILCTRACDGLLTKYMF